MRKQVSTIAVGVRADVGRRFGAGGFLGVDGPLRGLLGLGLGHLQLGLALPGLFFELADADDYTSTITLVDPAVPADQLSEGIELVELAAGLGEADIVTLHAAGTDPVFVSRLRRDLTHPRGVSMWVVADNVRKGAALNTIQIAELFL